MASLSYGFSKWRSKSNLLLFFVSSFTLFTCTILTGCYHISFFFPEFVLLLCVHEWIIFSKSQECPSKLLTPTILLVVYTCNYTHADFAKISHYLYSLYQASRTELVIQSLLIDRCKEDCISCFTSTICPYITSTTQSPSTFDCSCPVTEAVGKLLQTYFNYYSLWSI